MIYFIHDLDADCVKIGFSDNPAQRLSKLRADTPGDCELLSVLDGDLAAEAELHERFRAHNKRGEWFKVRGDLLDFLGTLPRYRKEPVTGDFWNGLSANEVARRTGLSKSMLSEIRSGKRRPSPEKAIELQRATGVSAIRLVFGDLAGEAT